MRLPPHIEIYLVDSIIDYGQTVGAFDDRGRARENLLPIIRSAYGAHTVRDPKEYCPHGVSWTRSCPRCEFPEGPGEEDGPWSPGWKERSTPVGQIEDATKPLPAPTAAPATQSPTT